MPARDFDLLASRILSFAKKALGDGGAVVPLGAAISLEGEFRPIQRIYSPNQKVTAPDLADEIVGVFRNLARDKQARSVAWCIATRLVPPGSTEPTDALVLFCESSTGEASMLVTPYRGAPGPTTTFATSYLKAHRPKVFVAAG
jgi:hypothetical protein